MSPLSNLPDDVTPSMLPGCSKADMMWDSANTEAESQLLGTEPSSIELRKEEWEGVMMEGSETPIGKKLLMALCASSGIAVTRLLGYYRQLDEWEHSDSPAPLPKHHLIPAEYTAAITAIKILMEVLNEMDDQMVEKRTQALLEEGEW